MILHFLVDSRAQNPKGFAVKIKTDFLKKLGPRKTSTFRGGRLGSCLDAGNLEFHAILATWKGFLHEREEFQDLLEKKSSNFAEFSLFRGGDPGVGGAAVKN